MEWLEFEPLEQLRDVVECYWVYDGSPDPALAQPVVLSPRPSMMVVFGRLGAAPAGTAAKGDGQGVAQDSATGPPPATRGGLFGVMFQPTGFFQLFGMPLSEVGAVAPFECAARRFGWALRHCVALAATHADRVANVEELLLAQLATAGACPPTVAAAAEEILLRNGQVRVSEVAREACLGRRQFERSFRAAVGDSPKRFAELSRLSYVFRLLKRQPLANWQDVTHACGYFDQAHFIREFRRFTGKSPKAYFEQDHAFEQAYWGR